MPKGNQELSIMELMMGPDKSTAYIAATMTAAAFTEVPLIDQESSGPHFNLPHTD